jgi:hypothetical protein
MPINRIIVKLKTTKSKPYYEFLTDCLPARTFESETCSLYLKK